MIAGAEPSDLAPLSGALERFLRDTISVIGSDSAELLDQLDSAAMFIPASSDSRVEFEVARHTPIACRGRTLTARFQGRTDAGKICDFSLVAWQGRLSSVAVVGPKPPGFVRLDMLAEVRILDITLSGRYEPRKLTDAEDQFVRSILSFEATGIETLRQQLESIRVTDESAGETYSCAFDVINGQAQRAKTFNNNPIHARCSSRSGPDYMVTLFTQHGWLAALEIGSLDGSQLDGVPSPATVHEFEHDE